MMKIRCATFITPLEGEATPLGWLKGRPEGHSNGDPKQAVNFLAAQLKERRAAV
jgi:hypothetical protein